MNKQTIIMSALLTVILLSLGIGMHNAEGYTDMKSNYAIAQKTAAGIVDPSDNTVKYNSNNFDVTYHDSIEKILSQNDVLGIDSGNAYVIDKSGNKVKLPPVGMGVSPTYYVPGSYKFGASTYVPSYEDSVYLSKTTGESSATPLQTATVAGGFCQANKDYPEKLEEECMKTDVNACASTSCCVLLGGSKCVSGNEQGPKKKENYGDTRILNRDYYYYKGKCYGNCSGTKFGYAPTTTSKTNGLNEVYKDNLDAKPETVNVAGR